MAGAEAVVVTGRAVETLHRLAEERGADLIAVGNHGHGRLATILIGSVSGEVLHAATRSVLVARLGDGDRLARVVAGVDGSPAGAAALERARAIAAHAGVPLRIVAAGGGKGIDAAALAAVDGVEQVAGGPVDALLQGAGLDDLIVVGSRGLHGLKSLGSVSERVAHKAPCSVLVVHSG
jgi:nucleotide-binding universal stress UspA family protein